LPLVTLEWRAMSGQGTAVAASARFCPTERLLRLRMVSRREAIAPMVERIVGFLDALPLDPDQRANLCVALAEGLSNAVVHGNSAGPERPVLVVCRLDVGRRATVDVRDFGRGFDVAALLDCRDADRVLAPSGRGVFLMRHLVDDVAFNRRGNRVRLTVHARAAERS
jgi:serine/threonine-protein kinase RsbW